MPYINNNNLSSIPQNVITEFRESFETYDTTNTWTQTTGTGDIAVLDGNAVGASYVVISKDPLTAGNETSIITKSAFACPIEMIVGLSMSQRVLGQECSIEFVSNDTPLPSVADIAISSIIQATTTLTVTTATAHGLSAGQRIGIYGVTSDSRFNYPSIIVATVVTTTQFTVTGGPGGTNIASVTAGPFTNQGYVYMRPALGYAQDGFSEIFENATTTNASFYVRSDLGDVYPSGTFAGNHSVTIQSTASVAAISSPYTYAFVPTTEFRFQFQQDKIQFYNVPIDSSSRPTSVSLRTQVVPNVDKQYNLRFRTTNNKGLTVPTAKIVSAVKSASTTATITTAAPHGLTTGDYIVIYGIRDQTNFANLTTATVVASTPTSTSFTIAFGVSATATSYGGMVSRVQGSNIPGSFQTIVLQSAAVTSTELTLVGSTNWAYTIGDYVNVYGCRDNTTGSDLNVDGSYKIVNQSTTTLTLIPIGTTTLPAPFATTNCGGTVIKRTDIRISFIRIFEYLRERVEILSRDDTASSVPVATTNTVTVSPITNNIYALVTSTNLGSSATYTGSSSNFAASSTSTTIYPVAVNIGVVHTAGLVPGTLYFDVGSETSSTAPTTWYQQFGIPIPSNSNWTTFTLPITARYYRLRFVNGATAQTTFRLTNIPYYNGSPSNTLTYPAQLLFNLSTTTLANGAVFTGSTLDFNDTNRLYKTLTATVFTDQASATDGFTIQVSRDGSTWRTGAKATVVANTLTTITQNLVYRYARVVYTNGSVTQTAFNLDCNAEV